MNSLVSLAISQDLSVTKVRDWQYLIINGILVLAASFTLLSIGPSMISSPEVSLYTLIETILGPVWVWLGGFEKPPKSSIYGGIALVTALFLHSIISLQKEHHVDESHIEVENVENKISRAESFELEVGSC